MHQNNNFKEIQDQTDKTYNPRAIRSSNHKVVTQTLMECINWDTAHPIYSDNFEMSKDGDGRT